jgi:hypothetical protein
MLSVLPVTTLFGPGPRHGLGDHVVPPQVHKACPPQEPPEHFDIGPERVRVRSAELANHLAHGAPHDPPPEHTIGGATCGQDCPHVAR